MTSTSVENELVAENHDVDSSIMSTDDDIDDFNSIAKHESSEVNEIRQMATTETKRVKSWRLLVTMMLLATGLVVTLTTHELLIREEYNKFDTAFRQFARSLADAALDQQLLLFASLRSLSTAISLGAESPETGESMWPNYHVPKFEALVEDLMKVTRAEVIGVSNVVKADEVESFLKYVSEHYEDFTKEGHMIAYGNLDLLDTNTSKFKNYIAFRGPNGFVPDIERDSYMVRLMQSPPLTTYGGSLNWNLGHRFPDVLEALTELRNQTVLGRNTPIQVLPPGQHASFHTDSNAAHPHNFFFHPIHRNATDQSSDIVATLSIVSAWDIAMRDLLPDNVQGLVAVVLNNCNQSFTYDIRGREAYFVGDGDHHDPHYDNLVMSVDLDASTHPNYSSTPGHCQYRMNIYPSDDFLAPYDSGVPRIFGFVVGATFLLVLIVFHVYDMMVYQRNEKLVSNAARSNAILSSLFPKSIRDRLLFEQTEKSNRNYQKKATSLKAFLADDKRTISSGSKNNDEEAVTSDDSKPLADLFLETTIIFADIVGFTAWSSVREPSQVFTLLESVFSAFDNVAKRRRIFKVETVGDCYVAVAGLPDPRSDHAIAMARFARDCMSTMRHTARKLEFTLGPDTGELSLRIGIHSGPVTAGVLRGERSRFQLFGDTMNTASRIESSSRAGGILVSQETASLLVEGGKESWLEKRVDKIAAKGKGDLQTYWLKTYDLGGTQTGSSAGCTGVDDVSSVASGATGSSDSAKMARPPKIALSYDAKIDRLVGWNIDILLRLIKQVVARRNALSSSRKASSSATKNTNIDLPLPKSDMPLSEVKEIITLPNFDRKAAKRQQDPTSIEISQQVVDELRDYVTCIAHLYRANSFHNFDHASHVVMSVVKLMSRIVAPPETSFTEQDSDLGSYNGTGSMGKSRHSNEEHREARRHDHTYGITSDPLTQFACAFSALIHDVDHSGVPNPQLIKENPDLAAMYKQRSVAEQNSFDLAWGLLMDNRFGQLRATLCSDLVELRRFRELVINGVMATDLGDNELKALRNGRWEKAFRAKTKKPEEPSVQNNVPMDEIEFEVGNEYSRDAVNRKATIVIEHLIQASDVAHTMQHWHIYRKWNERLFAEMYDAYQKGRSASNPAEFWYQGEIGFFDYYIIPLAKKLKDCGVFGISSDEYLTYAENNRAEWEARGREVVAEMLEKLQRQAGVTK